MSAPVEFLDAVADRVRRAQRARLQPGAEEGVEF